MPEVNILMAAYNGEKFIAEQIDSILAQTFQDFLLIIRDDGSSDNTPAIIDDYERRFPDKIKVVHDDVVCKDSAKNFFQLLTYADADYVMFSDQDDYWLPYKVQISLDYMKQAERENPCEPVLVFTGMEVVDAELKTMDKFSALGLPRVRYGFSELLHANCVSGCTEMFNRKLYENIGSYSDGMGIHDHWLALYAAACGVIRNVPMALMLYRQHENNVIGAGKHITFLDKLRKLCRSAKSYLPKPQDIINRMALSRQRFYYRGNIFRLFRSRYAEQIKPDMSRELDEFLKLWESSKFSRLAVFFTKGYPYATSFTIKAMVFLKLLLF